MTSPLACTAPDGNKPPPAIRAAIAHGNRLITSTIFRFAVAHFDADYSDRFRPNAGDNTMCPCAHRPYQPGHNPSRRRQRPTHRHTRNHVIFKCATTAASRTTHLQGLNTLPAILKSEEATKRLCCFLEVTNSSLMRPLPPIPVLRPGHDPP
jgi:hypothetical protein